MTTCYVGVFVLFSSYLLSVRAYYYQYRYENQVAGSLWGDKNLQDCGTSSKGGVWRGRRIVGGELSIDNQWPWLVSLQRNIDEAGQIHNCGGTLIDEEWVLTAAHCFDDPNQSSDPADWLAVVGEHNIQEEQEVASVDISIQAVYLPPARRVGLLKLDIALVHLATAVRLGDTVGLGCLPGPDVAVPVGTECVVAGWGHTQSGGNLADEVRHVTVPLVSKRSCERRYRRVGARLGPDILCAGHNEGGKDSCQGDSGGPLMCEDHQTGRWIVLGVVSNGYGCALANYPGLYTQTSHHMRWIQEIISSN